MGEVSADVGEVNADVGADVGGVNADLGDRMPVSD